MNMINTTIESKFKENLSYISAQMNEYDKHDNKQRKSKKIWYNPPYSANI